MFNFKLNGYNFYFKFPKIFLINITLYYAVVEMRIGESDKNALSLIWLDCTLILPVGKTHVRVIN